MRGLPVRLGLEGVQRARARSAGSSCRPGCGSPTACPEPIFTPATKAELGEHDENVDFDRAAEIVGDRATMEELRRLSLELYGFAAEHAERNGIILADTKFEFGRDASGADRARRRGPDARLLPLLARATATSPAAPSPPSTSSTCATGSTSPAGTTRRPARSCPPRWWPARAPSTSRPTSASRAGRSTTLARPVEGPRPDPAQGGDPRPAGPGGRAGAAGARLRGRLERPRRPAGRAGRRRATATSPARVARDVRAAAREPADRELRGRSRSSAMAERRHRRLPRLLRRGGRRARGAPHARPRAALPLARRRAT